MNLQPASTSRFLPHQPWPAGRWPRCRAAGGGGTDRLPSSFPSAHHHTDTAHLVSPGQREDGGDAGQQEGHGVQPQHKLGHDAEKHACSSRGSSSSSSSRIRTELQGGGSRAEEEEALQYAQALGASHSSIPAKAGQASKLCPLRGRATSHCSLLTCPLEPPE